MYVSASKLKLINNTVCFVIVGLRCCRFWDKSYMYLHISTSHLGGLRGVEGVWPVSHDVLDSIQLMNRAGCRI